MVILYLNTAVIVEGSGGGGVIPYPPKNWTHQTGRTVISCIINFSIFTFLHLQDPIHIGELNKEETTDDQKRSVNTVQYWDVQWEKTVIDQGVEFMENPFRQTTSLNQGSVPARMRIPTKSMFCFLIQNCWLRKSGHAMWIVRLHDAYDMLAFLCYQETSSSLVSRLFNFRNYASCYCLKPW